MNISDHRIKTYFHTNKDAFFRRDHLQETIEKSKAAFYENEAGGILSRAEFIYCQSRYIHKRWWVLQACVLFMLWLLLDVTESDFYTKRCMGIAAPLFAVLLLPELWKNKSCGAVEIEGAALFPLRRIYAARMLLFAFTDALLLGIFSSAALASGRLAVVEIVSDFFLPYIITCCISFRTFYNNRIVSESFALLSCTVFAALWTQLVLNEKIYAAITAPAWFLALAAALFYLGFCIYRGQRNCRQLSEVYSLWN